MHSDGASSGSQKGFDGKRTRRLPDHGFARNQDPPEAQEREHRRADRNLQDEAGSQNEEKTGDSSRLRVLRARPGRIAHQQTG